MTTGIATHQPLGFIVSLGLLGGGALIATASLSTRGPLIYIPYAAIVLASAAYLRFERVQPFATRFGLSLGAFMVATLLLYLFIGLFRAKTLFVISPLGHAWRLGLMLLIGSALSAAVAQLTATSQQP